MSERVEPGTVREILAVGTVIGVLDGEVHYRVVGAIRIGHAADAGDFALGTERSAPARSVRIEHHPPGQDAALSVTIAGGRICAIAALGPVPIPVVVVDLDEIHRGDEGVHTA